MGDHHSTSEPLITSETQPENIGARADTTSSEPPVRSRLLTSTASQAYEKNDEDLIMAYPFNILQSHLAKLMNTLKYNDLIN